MTRRRRLVSLLNPKWTGKISFPDPTRHTTTAQFFWNLRHTFKGEKWLDYVKALAKQKPILVESLAPVTTTIIKGEAEVGIAYIKYIKQYKGPVSYVAMDKYLTDPNYLALGAKSTHRTPPNSTSTLRALQRGKKRSPKMANSSWLRVFIHRSKMPRKWRRGWCLWRTRPRKSSKS